MSTQHRLDIAAWRQHSRTKEVYTWLYINLEDLTKRTPLLLLLHYQGRHQPYEFVHSDLKQARLSEASDITMPGFLNGYTMLFVDRTALETYGELVSWDDDAAAFENMTNGVGMCTLGMGYRFWRYSNVSGPSLLSAAGFCCKTLFR